MRNIVNKSDFVDGAKMYVYLNNFVLNGSGDCELNITNDDFEAANRSHHSVVYEVTLKELPIKKKTVTKTIEVEEKSLS